MDDEVVVEWERLWSSGVSVLWGQDVHDQVARLAAFRIQFRYNIGVNVDTMARLHPQITKLEDSLLLSTKAQRSAGIEVADVADDPAVQADELARKREELRARASGG